MPGGDLVFYVKLELKPERVDEWKAAASDLIEQMSHEKTFVSCSLQQDTQDPTCFTLFERWSEPSVETFIRNQVEAKPYRQDYEARLPGMLRTPRTTSVLRHVEEWRRT